MAQGIKQGIFGAPRRGIGKVLEKEGDACTAGNELLPMLSDGPKPKIPLTCGDKFGKAQTGGDLRIRDKLLDLEDSWIHML